MKDVDNVVGTSAFPALLSCSVKSEVLKKIFGNIEPSVRLCYPFNYDDPWFVVKDLCEMLGFDDSLVETITYDWLDSTNCINGIQIKDGMGTHHVAVTNASGLIILLSQSKFTRAVVVTSWLNNIVIPAILFDGEYTPEYDIKYPKRVYSLVCDISCKLAITWMGAEQLYNEIILGKPMDYDGYWDGIDNIPSRYSAGEPLQFLVDKEDQ